MSFVEASTQTAPGPKRADARRNHELILQAAWNAFAEGGESTTLEEIARRAGVGIGTLYRHFPSRQALLESLYVKEVEEVCCSTARLDDDPWRAFSAWCERLIDYLTTKRALAQELVNYLGEDNELFKQCRSALFDAGEPLLERAQDAGAARADVDFADVLHMLAGITRIPGSDRRHMEHVMRIALDGLRYRPPA